MLAEALEDEPDWRGILRVVKGIQKLDPKLIRKGFQKATTGFQEVNDATEELFQFLRSQ